MTKEQFCDQIMSSWLDNNGLVKSKYGNTDSGNGVLFSSIAIILNPEMSTFLWKAIDRCFAKAGLLMRTPQNTYGQEQQDDLMGLLAACISVGDTYRPRQILKYGIKHFGFYNTDGKLERKDFLFRFIPFDLMLICAAFPQTRIFLKPLAWIISTFFMNATAHDNPGEYILEWIFGTAFNLKNREHVNFAFGLYYGFDHPFYKMEMELFP